MFIITNRKLSKQEISELKSNIYNLYIGLNVESMFDKNNNFIKANTILKYKKPIKLKVTEAHNTFIQVESEPIDINDNIRDGYLYFDEAIIEIISVDDIKYKKIFIHKQKLSSFLFSPIMFKFNLEF